MSWRQVVGVSLLVVGASVLSYSSGHARGWSEGVYAMTLVMGWRGGE